MPKNQILSLWLLQNLKLDKTYVTYGRSAQMAPATFFFWFTEALSAHSHNWAQPEPSWESVESINGKFPEK